MANTYWAFYVNNSWHNSNYSLSKEYNLQLGVIFVKNFCTPHQKDFEIFVKIVNEKQLQGLFSNLLLGTYILSTSLYFLFFF